jgi:hypothetical protein
VPPPPTAAASAAAAGDAVSTPSRPQSRTIRGGDVMCVHAFVGCCISLRQPRAYVSPTPVCCRELVGHLDPHRLHRLLPWTLPLLRPLVS